MRTSVDLPDQLMKKAKIKAVEEEITLKELIIRALENEIGLPKGQAETSWNDLKGKGSADTLKPGDSGFGE